MLLSVIIILVVGGTAYFHYIQGFFSATISAILAILAAVLAVSYHEPIVTSLLGGKFADVAPGMTLCVLFAAIYLLLRTVADKFVPGNLRMPVIADKVGSIVMGIVAGLFAGGVVAIAAQSLPMGSSVGMFSRYETNDQRDVRLPTSGQSEDTFVYGELKDADIEKLRSDDRHSLWVPADEVLLATVQKLSNEGSLAGSRTLSSVHPDYLEELFLSNVGIQVGAKRTAINLNKQQDVDVPDKGLFTVASLPQAEGEMEAIRVKRNLPATLSPKGSDMILIVRVLFDRKASDSDNKVRFSTGACRLVANGQNFYPHGTLEGGKLLANALDDFLVCESGKGPDLVYVVPKADVLSNPKAEGDKMTIADGVFIEVKRLGRVELGGKKVLTSVAPSKDVGLFRKESVLKAAGAPAKPAGGGASSASSEPQEAGPLHFEDVQADAHLPFKVGTGTADKTTNSFQTSGVTGGLADGKFTKLEVDGTQSVQMMSRGTYPADELAAPGGQKVVKVHLTPTGDNPQAFEGQIGNYKLVDAGGTQHAVRGVIVTVKAPGGADRMAVSYNSGGDVGSVPHADGRPTDVWLVFTVPGGTQLKNITFNGQNIGATELTVEQAGNAVTGGPG